MSKKEKLAEFLNSKEFRQMVEQIFKQVPVRIQEQFKPFNERTKILRVELTNGDVIALKWIAPEEEQRDFSGQYKRSGAGSIELELAYNALNLPNTQHCYEVFDLRNKEVYGSAILFLKSYPNNLEDILLDQEKDETEKTNWIKKAIETYYKFCQELNKRIAVSEKEIEIPYYDKSFLVDDIGKRIIDILTCECFLAQYRDDTSPLPEHISFSTLRWIINRLHFTGYLTEKKIKELVEVHDSENIKIHMLPIPNHFLVEGEEIVLCDLSKIAFGPPELGIAQLLCHPTVLYALGKENWERLQEFAKNQYFEIVEEKPAPGFRHVNFMNKFKIYGIYAATRNLSYISSLIKLYFKHKMTSESSAYFEDLKSFLEESKIYKPVNFIECCIDTLGIIVGGKPKYEGFFNFIRTHANNLIALVKENGNRTDS